MISRRVLVFFMKGECRSWMCFKKRFSSIQSSSPQILSEPDEIALSLKKTNRLKGQELKDEIDTLSSLIRTRIELVTNEHTINNLSNVCDAILLQGLNADEQNHFLSILKLFAKFRYFPTPSLRESILKWLQTNINRLSSEHAFDILMSLSSFSEKTFFDVDLISKLGIISFDFVEQTDSIEVVPQYFWLWTKLEINMKNLFSDDKIQRLFEVSKAKISLWHGKALNQILLSLSKQNIEPCEEWWNQFLERLKELSPLESQQCAMMLNTFVSSSVSDWLCIQGEFLFLLISDLYYNMDNLLLKPEEHASAMWSISKLEIDSSVLGVMFMEKYWTCFLSLLPDMNMLQMSMHFTVWKSFSLEIEDGIIEELENYFDNLIEQSLTDDDHCNGTFSCLHDLSVKQMNRVLGENLTNKIIELWLRCFSDAKREHVAWALIHLKQMKKKNLEEIYCQFWDDYRRYLKEVLYKMDIHNLALHLSVWNYFNYTPDSMLINMIELKISKLRQISVNTLSRLLFMQLEPDTKVKFLDQTNCRLLKLWLTDLVPLADGPTLALVARFCRILNSTNLAKFESNFDWNLIWKNLSTKLDSLSHKDVCSLLLMDCYGNNNQIAPKLFSLATRLSTDSDSAAYLINILTADKGRHHLDKSERSKMLRQLYGTWMEMLNSNTSSATLVHGIKGLKIHGVRKNWFSIAKWDEFWKITLLHSAQIKSSVRDILIEWVDREKLNPPPMWWFKM